MFHSGEVRVVVHWARGTCISLELEFKPEEGSSMFRRNVDTYLPECVIAQNTTRVFIRQSV